MAVKYKKVNCYSTIVGSLMLPKIHGSLEKIFTLDGSYLNKSIGEVGLSTNKQF